MKNLKGIRSWMGVFFLFAVLGCVTEEGIQEDWDDWVADHNACATADECVAVYPGCPLGCYAAVASEHEAEAVDHAESLVNRYERGGRACAYSCVEPGALACIDGACGFEEAPVQ